MVLPTCPFPNLLWLALYAGSSEVWLEGQENYVKQTWRNRFDIRGVNKTQSLSMHVQGMGGNKVGIQQVQLEEGNWRREHVMSLRSAYGSAPFAVHYLDDIVDLLLSEESALFAFNWKTIQWTLEALDLNPLAGTTTGYTPADPGGLRANFKSGKWNCDLPDYPQMFPEKRAFASNLSAIDLLMNLGPESRLYLEKIKALNLLSP